MGNPYNTNGLIRKTKQNFQRTFYMKETTGGRSALREDFLVEVTQDYVKIFMLKLGVPLPGS
jgi:hypothetical protein